MKGHSVADRPQGIVDEVVEMKTEKAFGIDFQNLSHPGVYEITEVSRETAMAPMGMVFSTFFRLQAYSMAI
jgi:hypothetical protein